MQADTQDPQLGGQMQKLKDTPDYQALIQTPDLMAKKRKLGGRFGVNGSRGSFSRPGPAHHVSSIQESLISNTGKIIMIPSLKAMSNIKYNLGLAD